MSQRTSLPDQQWQNGPRKVACFSEVKVGMGGCPSNLGGNTVGGFEPFANPQICCFGLITEAMGKRLTNIVQIGII